MLRLQIELYDLSTYVQAVIMLRRVCHEPEVKREKAHAQRKLGGTPWYEGKGSADPGLVALLA